MSDEDEDKRGPGRPKKEIPAIGDNINPVKKKIADAFDKVAKHEKDRQATNQEIQAIREQLYADGIPKEAFDLVKRYLEWDASKRRNFDLAYAICREAAGEPIQRDLFDKLDGDS